MIKLDQVPVPPTHIQAQHVSGRIADVFVDNPVCISKGHFGYIYEVTTRTVGSVPAPGNPPPFDSRRRAHMRPAVIKLFLSPGDAERAHSLYDVCHDAGLRTPPTYRIDARQRVAIITELNTKGAVAISGNNWSIGADALQKNKIYRINNWSDVLERLFNEEKSEVRLATDYEIELQEDVYFFLVPLTTDTPLIDFVACDFDAVRHPSKRDSTMLFQSNVLYLRTTCELFVRKYVQPQMREEHLRALDAVCAPLLPSHARRVSEK